MRSIAITASCLLVLLISGQTFALERIILTNGEWPPLTSQTLPGGGIFTKLCTTAFELEGVSVEYEYMPWARAMDAAHHGEFAGTVAWRKSPKWEREFLYSDPVQTIDTVFFHHESRTLEWEELQDIGHMTIGATRGFLYVDLLGPIVEKHGGRLDIANDNLTSMKKLASSRIDLFPCAKSVGAYLLNVRMSPEDSAQIRMHDKPFMRGELYLLISRKRRNGPAIIDTFNRGLRKMHETGLYGRIIDSWDENLHRLTAK